MNVFPQVDPIPLPAPVWLFKSLHILTLSLHFIAVKILLGGLLLAVILSLLGKAKTVYQPAAFALAKRLPIVMTYVINLGIPPLLFAQVLYGPALYTSNVLIGTFWFSIIPLLMACYWFLYGFSDGVAAGKAVWYKGLIAWILAGCISRILSTNMALMIQPEVWQGMYAQSPSGNHLPPFDATLTPRWLFMLCGAGWVSGFWLIWVAGRKDIQASAGAFLSGLGGKLAAGMIILQAIEYHAFLNLQPGYVLQGIESSTLLKASLIAYYVICPLVLTIAVWAALKRPCSYGAGYCALLTVVLSVSSWTILRDGIRDLTLSAKGFDVWKQIVVTNWQVVGAFLLVFGLGIAALVWLIWVMMKSRPMVEGGAA